MPRHLGSLTGRTGWLAVLPYNSLLSDREEDGVCCRAGTGPEYAVFFPDGREVNLSLPGKKSALTVEWINILNANWQEAALVKAGKQEITLIPTGNGL